MQCLGLSFKLKAMDVAQWLFLLGTLSVLLGFVVGLPWFVQNTQYDERKPTDD